jgi:hypothetical protein
MEDGSSHSRYKEDLERPKCGQYKFCGKGGSGGDAAPAAAVAANEKDGGNEAKGGLEKERDAGGEGTADIMVVAKGEETAEAKGAAAAAAGTPRLYNCGT